MRLYYALLRRSTLLTLAVLLVQWPPGTAASERTWDWHAARGNYFYKQNRLGESLQEYRNAIRLLKKDPATPKYLLADVQLSAVLVMADAKNFAEAESALKEVNQYSSTLKENRMILLRYWKRLSVLQSAKHDYTNAAITQREVCTITAQTFGTSSPVAAEETKRLLDLLTTAGRWTEAIQAAGQLSKVQKLAEPLSLANTYKEWLSYFGSELVKKVLSDFQSHSLSRIKEGLDLLCSYTPFANRDDKHFWTSWQTITTSLSISPELQEKSCWCLLKAVEIPSASEAQLAAINFAATTLFFRRVFQERKIDTRTEELGNFALSAQDLMWNPKQRTGEAHHIQTAATQAYVLAKIGKLKQAEELVDNTVLDPAVFKDGLILDGIFQARYFALVHHYEQKKDVTGVQRQFKKLYETLDSLSPFKEKEELYKEWKRLEKVSVQNASKR